MNYKEQVELFDKETDFNELVKIIWQSRYFVLLIISIFSIVSLSYSLSLSNIYTSKSTLAPTSMDATSNLTSQYSSIAAIAGIDLSGSDGEVEVALAFINSQKLVSQLMKYDSFLPELIAALEWEKNTNELIYDLSLYDANTKQWVRKVESPRGIIPSSQEAYKLFSDKVSLTQNKRNSLITLNVSHISPIVAQKWSIWIIKEVNSLVANMKVVESQSSIDYLNDQIKITPYPELRTMFYELIQNKTQSMMLAKVNPEYVLTTIDPPVIPETKSSPNRLFIFINGIAFGLMSAILVILIRYFTFNINRPITLSFQKF